MKNITSVIIASVLVIVACLFLSSCSDEIFKENGRYRIVSEGQETILEGYRICGSSQNYGQLVVNCFLPDTPIGSPPDLSIVVDSFERLPEEK